MPAFIIPGKPYAKKRPRFSRATGRAYDPAGNSRTEDSIGAIACRYFNAPIEGAVDVIIEAQFAPAASWSKAKRAAAMGQPHTQKPDCDNLGKTVLDALNRIAWADDGQVSSITIRKVWGPVDQTRVSITAALQEVA